MTSQDSEEHAAVGSCAANARLIDDEREVLGSDGRPAPCTAGAALSDGADESGGEDDAVSATSEDMSGESGTDALADLHVKPSDLCYALHSVPTLELGMFAPLVHILGDVRGEVSNRCFQFFQSNGVDHALIERLAASCVVLGGEKDGKSTTLANLMQAPIVYSATDTATRCVVNYVLQFDASATTPMVTVIDGTHASKRTTTDSIPIELLPGRVEEIMTRIKVQGVAKRGQVTVVVRSNDPSRQALRLVDMPGLVGDSAREMHGGEAFRDQVRDLVKQWVRNSLLAPGSTSHALLVMKANANLRNGSVLSIINSGPDGSPNTPIDSDRLHLVLTHGDEWLTPKNIRSLLAQHKQSLCDSGLLHVIRSRTGGMLGPKVSIHIVANTLADVHEQRSFEEAQHELQEDANNRELVAMLDSLPSHIPGYRRDQSYDAVRKMLGADSLREVAKRCTNEGVERQLEFIGAALQQRKERVLERAKECKQRLTQLGANAGSSEGVSTMLLHTAAKLLASVATGEYEPAEGSFLMPTKEQWSAVARERAVRLEDERRPTFPENLDEGLLERILDLLHNGQRGLPTFSLSMRLYRLVPLLVLLMLLPVPEVVSADEISIFQVANAHEQAGTSQRHIAVRLTTFLKQQLHRFSDYLQDVTRGMLEHGVETVICMMSLVNIDSFFAENAGDGTSHETTAERKARLFDDLRKFMRDTFVEPTVVEVSLVLKGAEAPLRDGIAPWVPETFGKLHEILPTFEEYKKVFESDNRSSKRHRDKTREYVKSASKSQGGATTGGAVLAAAAAAASMTTMAAGADSDPGTVMSKLRELLGKKPKGSQLNIVNMFAPVITQLCTMDTVSRPKSITQVLDDEVIQFNVAYRRHALTSNFLTAIQIPMTVAKPVSQNINQRAQSVEFGAFSGFVKRQCRSKTEQDVFECLEDPKQAGAAATSSATASSLAATVAATSGDFLKEQYGFQSPQEAIVNRMQALRNELDAVAAAARVVEDYKRAVRDLPLRE